MIDDLLTGRPFTIKIYESEEVLTLMASKKAVPGKVSTGPVVSKTAGKNPGFMPNHGKIGGHGPKVVGGSIGTKKGK